MAENKEEPIVQEEEDGSAVITVPEGTTLPEVEEKIATEPVPPGEPVDEEEEEEGDETLKKDVDQRRQDRKEERQRKKVARDLAIERARLQEEHNRRLQSEVEDLKKRLADVDRRTTSTEIAGAQQQLNDAALEEQYWKQQRQMARKENNTDAEAEAEDKLYAARRKRENISAAIENAKRIQSRPPQQQQTNIPDPEVQRMARDWHTKNAWYKPSGADEPSRVVKALDEAIAAEGYDPKSAAYYAELDRRIAKYLPDRAGGATSGPSDQRPNRPVVTGSGRDATPAPKANEFRLSADRVRAMKDAGVWDDPAKRAKFIKQYVAFDRQNRNANG